MTSSFLVELGRAAAKISTSSTLVLAVLVALLLFCVPPARALTIDVLCHIYVAIFHRPFRSSPTDFLYSRYEAPLPSTNPTWSRIQASTVLKWRAQRKGLRHGKQIDWDRDNAVKDGDMIEAWDRIVEWDQRCLHPHKLGKLRRIGDPLADRALEQLESSVAVAAQPKTASTDALRRIYDQASEQNATSSEKSDCLSFWKAIDRRPPPGAGALGLDWYESHCSQDAIASLPHWPQYPSTNKPEPVATLPIWTPDDATAIDATSQSAELEAEAEVIRRGQDVFYRYAGPMLTVLLHFSLAGGFASPRITHMLKQTAYLVPTAAASRAQNSKSSGTPLLPTVEELQTFKMDKARADRTWNRLLETTQFVLDVVEKADSLTPARIAALSAPGADTADGKGPLISLEMGGDGWQSAVRVRLLHTNVRRRVLKLVERDRNGFSGTKGEVYDVDKNGIPINQEDMLGTLCAFASAPLAMLQRIGVRPSAQERKDYIALWRHVGFYMGIEPALLRRAFADAQGADRTMWCTVLHLFSQVEVLEKNAFGLQPRMQGPTIPVLIACADRPPFHTPLSAHVAISRRLLGKSLADSLALPASCARREVLSDTALLGMQVPILFGYFYPRQRREKRRLELARPLSPRNKRTRFEMPSSEQVHKVQGEDKREKVNVETQSSAHVDVPENKEHIMRLAREWRWLMREMVAVPVMAVLAPVALSLYVYLNLGSHLRLSSWE
ncbi:uncharacterized protein SPSC_04431 [Sporisorium scitamineum]|uniref:ER-bound oxygenase mpaB/mpaB'/Rubber oxygenase catalytic domain-containing protein n=1 Tax=Sporisorium scitamineum TaxID=49012 RepID=A0A127Z435_9BASI|nr:uncharacterized protein SPSC_04431 [Sporisorium scitamineum]